jgi:DNA-binding winged helix-turn-helix (wHTH) protein
MIDKRMAAAPRQRYRFDDLTLDVGQCRVWRGGQPIQLSKLTFDLLRVLVEAAPNLVTHDQLAQHVWGTRRIVTPENLSQRLMMLRQAIGDPADRPRYIEGVRGLGYRLIPAVAAEDERNSSDAALEREGDGFEAAMRMNPDSAALARGRVVVFGVVVQEQERVELPHRVGDG